MKSQDLNQEQKLQIILCGPLPQTEAALLRRGDVEIIRENDNLNLLGGMANGFIDCDMIIVEAPYGHGLYGMTYPVGERKTCPVWMVADPPDEFVWKEINWQLSEVPAKRREARKKAIAAGPPKHEILLLTDTPQRRSDFSGWMREIYAIWKMTLPPLVAPEDVKAYLRELHDLQKEDVPPELVVIAMEGVDSLNIADHIRELYPKTGLIWSCDLNFSLQAFHHQADYFFFLNEASRETLGTGLTRWQYRVEQHKDRGNDTNYDTAKVNVSVTVAKATPILTAPTAGAIQYGQKLSDSTLTGGTATNPNGNAAVAGSWSWASGNTRPTADGDFPVAFVPGDTANYNTPGNVDASVTVTPAAPKITLTVPAYQVANGVVEVKYTAANPHDATLNDLPAVTLTYKVGSGAEQPITDGKFTIPEGTAVDTVITVIASTAAVDGKYTAATKMATVTVTDKIPVEISGVSVTGRAYNGKAIDHTGTPVIKTLDGKTVTDATVTYTWSSGGDTGPINAGNYTLTISVDGEKYIGSTTVDFTIEKATVTITAVNKSAVVGSAQPELTYTVSGLADGETLATVPTLTCTPDMNTVGSYSITASGAAVPNTGNYNTTITYVDGTLSVTAKPSTGGGGYVPSNPGGSTLPVTTTGQGSTTTTTTTTATPTASVGNGTATTTINTAMGQEIVRQATANKSENVVIAPSVTGNVTKAEVSIPASTVGQIGSQTSASLTVSTPVADVTIPNGGLGSLSSAGGTVTVTAEQVGSSVELTVTAGGRTIQNVPGGVTLTVPAANTTPGTVAVLVHPDGTREVVRKSVADNGAVTIPLDGSAKLEIVDNSRQFADVPATSWAADAVAFASAHELFGGTGANQFSPDLPMSRGMLAVVLHNLENNPAQALTGAFADVDNSQWYAEGVAWAEAQGIIGGYGNGWFGPNDNITREQLAVMLWRYSGSPAATDRELHFADAHRASDWASSPPPPARRKSAIRSTLQPAGSWPSTASAAGARRPGS